MTTKTIRAVYVNGVFRPTERVDLPEQSTVEFEARTVEPSVEDQQLDGVYAILSQSYETGDPHAAARHNDHQP